MCNNNLFLKLIITFIFMVIVFFLDNYYLFWLLSFFVLFLSIIDKNYVGLLFVFLLVCILLFCTFTTKIMYIVKVITCFSFFTIFIMSTSKKDRENFKYKYLYQDERNRKKLFYDRYYDKVVNDLRKKYDGEIPKEVIQGELDKLYLYGKLKFYGYSNKITSSRVSRFTVYDLLLSMVSLSILVLIFIYR